MNQLNVHTLREGDGVPLVLLHGFMGCGLDWETCVAADEFPARPVYAVDLPAHGDSPDFAGEWSFAEAAAAIVDALPDDESFDLVGYSMGGRLALYLAGTRRGLIRSLVLIGAHPGIEHPQDRSDRVALDDARASLLVEAPDVFVSEWGQLELFGPATSKGWAAVRARRQETAEANGYRWARALTSLTVGHQLPMWNVPYMTETPTLFLAGSRDDKYVEVGTEFKAQNPDHVELGIIVNAHHAPHLDRPDAVARRISKFLMTRLWM